MKSQKMRRRKNKMATIKKKVTSHPAKDSREKKILKVHKVLKSKDKPEKSAKRSVSSTVAKPVKPSPSVVGGKVKSSKLSADVYDLSGRKKGTQTLPKELFGAKVNQKLLAQAMHIYFTNQSSHNASAKTRAETRGGGAKPWRQKGTGRARAGSKRSPIWVGGGIAHGPKPRKVQLTLPKKMKHQALISALSSKAQDGGIKIISNIEKIEPKTKIVANFLKKLDIKGSTLFVTSGNSPAGGQNVKLASRNLSEAFCDIASNLNAFEIIKNRNIFFSQEAIRSLSGNR